MAQNASPPPDITNRAMDRKIFRFFLPPFICRDIVLVSDIHSINTYTHNQLSATWYLHVIIGSHVRINPCYFICLGYFFQFFFSEKIYFPSYGRNLFWVTIYYPSQDHIFFDTIENWRVEYSICTYATIIKFQFWGLA